MGHLISTAFVVSRILQVFTLEFEDALASKSAEDNGHTEVRISRPAVYLCTPESQTKAMAAKVNTKDSELRVRARTTTKSIEHKRVTGENL